MSIQATPTTTDSKEPLLLRQARDQIRTKTSDLDPQLLEAIAELREWCEVFTARTLRTTITRTISYECWPSSPVRLPWPPLIAVTSITYYDVDGNEQTVSTDDYRVHLSHLLQGQVEFVSDWSAPVLEDRLDAVTITYTCGYATREDIPRGVARAIKLLLSIEFDDVPPQREENARERAKDCLRSIEWGPYR